MLIVHKRYHGVLLFDPNASSNVPFLATYHVIDNNTLRILHNVISIYFTFFKPHYFTVYKLATFLFTSITIYPQKDYFLMLHMVELED